LNSIIKKKDKQFEFREILITSENLFDEEINNSKNLMKRLALAYITKIKKRFINLPIFLEFKAFDFEKIKSLHDRDLDNWGNDSILKLTNHFKILNFDKSNNQEIVFDSKVMIYEYKTFKN